MNNNDSLGDLLKALNDNPAFIRDIIFEPDVVIQVLGRKAAGRILSGAVSATEFLRYMASPKDGHAYSFCGSGTERLVAKGTQLYVQRTMVHGKPPRKTRKKRAAARKGR